MSRREGMLPVCVQAGDIAGSVMPLVASECVWQRMEEIVKEFGALVAL